MNSREEADLKLERLLDGALRRLPLRHAPATLEPRVLAELALRQAVPWWQQSFARWPRVARLAFIAVCSGLSGITLLGGAAMAPGVGAVGGGLSRLMQQWSTVLTAAAQTMVSLVHAIPVSWLYEGAAVAALLYVTLFALGAAAYRALYLNT
jgi:hypothetical protein